MCKCEFGNLYVKVGIGGYWAGYGSSFAPMI